MQRAIASPIRWQPPPRPTRADAPVVSPSVPRRSSLPATALADVALVIALVLAVACSPARAPQDGPVAAPTTTTPPTSTTTTTVPVPADLAEIVTATTLTERGRRIFLAASPAIEDATTFARSCGVDSVADSPDEPRVHTQGCYVNGRIHLLSIDGAEGRDLLYVVAAHELLHAAYASMGPAERGRVDAELNAARVGNERLEDRLLPYGSGPTLENEIHSILGSEFAGLSPPLEAHYAQYFADRSRVVAARQRTLGAREDEIARRKAEVDELEARIASLKDAQEALRATNEIREYNANVPVVNGLISRYNTAVEELNALIAEYNALLGTG